VNRADWVHDALARLGVMARPEEPLAPHTTYRLGGPAAVWAEPTTHDDLRLVGQVARDLDVQVLVVGRGSNLLVADAGFDGIAVSLLRMADRIEFDGTVVHVGGSTALPVLARRCTAAGLVGMEWAVGVPGSVGGAVRMNAGGHGSDIAASLVTVEIVDLRTGRTGEVPAARLGLRFRGSDLVDEQVVVSATLRLARGDVAASEAHLAEIVRWRREHQPGGQNAGSVFVNPVPGEVAAAALIDREGLRGYRVGGAVVSEKHANFVQAGPGATAADVVAVMRHVRAVVEQRTGVRLRSEIRLVGFGALAREFDAADAERAGDRDPSGVVV